MLVRSRAAVEDGAGDAVGDFVGAAQGEEVFAGQEDVAANGAGGAADDLFEVTLKDGVGFVFADDPVGAVLLELFDDGVGEEDLDAREQGVVLKARHGDGGDLGHAGRFDRPDVVAGATAEEQGGERQEEGEPHCGGFGRSGSGVEGRDSGSGGSTAGSILLGEVRSLGLPGAPVEMTFSSGRTTGGPT